MKRWFLIPVEPFIPCEGDSVQRNIIRKACNEDEAALIAIQEGRRITGRIKEETITTWDLL